MKSAGLFKKAIALTMSTSMLLGSGGYTKALRVLNRIQKVRTIQPLSSMQIHMKVVQMLRPPVCRQEREPISRHSSLILI